MRLLERHLIGIAFAFLLAITVPSESHAASGVTILAHDVVQNPIVTTASQAAVGPNTAPNRSLTVAFTAFGNRFVLDLQPNDRLVASMLADLRHAGHAPGVYYGTISSRPETWARIAVDDIGLLSGVIWDGAELLILDQASRLFEATKSTSGVNETVAVWASDIRVTIADGIGGISGPQVESLDKIFEASKATLNHANVSRAISLGLVLADDYVGNSPSQTIQRAIELTNIADGIFVAQAAVHLNIEYIKVFDADTPDPFTSTEPGTLLDQLVELKQGDPALASMGLVHLFTRTDLDGDTRGIAKVASFCAPNRGAGLTVGRGSTIDALIMAHEIGHNFGARHDGVSGEGCGSTPQSFLMAPEISGSSVFSQCSVDKMMQTLNSVSCLTQLPASEISISAPVLPAQVLYGEQLQFEYVVTNEGLESAVDSSLIVSTEDVVELQGNGSPDRSCGYAGPQPSHRCDLLSLYPGESVTVSYAMIARQVGDIQLDGIANASNDTNPHNNAVESTVEVIMATDLTPSGDEVANGSSDIKPGQSVEFAADVWNRGDFESNALVTVSTSYNHSLTTTSACSAINDFTLRCDIGNLQPGTSRSIGFVAHSDAAMVVDANSYQFGEVQVRVDGSIADYAPHNDNANLRFKMWGTIKDLYSEFTQPPVSIELGEARELRGVFGNHGPDAAANVQASILSFSAGIRIDDVDLDKGSCERRGPERFDCQIGSLAAGETVGVTATYTGETAGDYRLQIDAHENFNGHEADGENSYDFVEIAVKAPPPVIPAPPAEKTQSGGGSTSLALLVALLFAWRRRLVLSTEKLAISYERR